MASDLHITVPANSAQIVLAGSPQSIRLAKDLIAKLDAAQPLVVLDTEVLEVDENAAHNIGLQLPGASISSTWTEVQPTPNPLNGQPGVLDDLQQLTRTPIQFTAELNLLVQHGNARVLADPRVTTISGHTAPVTPSRSSHKRAGGRDSGYAATADLPNRRHARHNATGWTTGQRHCSAASSGK
jgi:type II secretory pathway component GspD/PulD (secretin)